MLPELLQRLLQYPYFAARGPRSTGKEAFNLAWLDDCLGRQQPAPVDVQATLAELTASSIAHDIRECAVPIDEVYICGGGAHNRDLMERLRQKLSPASLGSTAQLGMEPDWVEAVAFAWLASRTLDGLAGNAPAVTGASGVRVLGGIFTGG